MASRDDEEEQPVRSRYQAPYQQSRAALRKLYGARKIGGPTTYSERDTTPSAREARAMERGATPTQAAAIAEQKFYNSFTQRPNIVEQFSRRAFQTQNQGGWETPMPGIQKAISQGLTGKLNVPHGQVVLPNTPNPSSLLPPVGPIDQISDFMPTTTGPLSSFNLPRPSLLNRRPSFG